MRSGINGYEQSKIPSLKILLERSSKTSGCRWSTSRKKGILTLPQLWRSLRCPPDQELRQPPSMTTTTRRLLEVRANEMCPMCPIPPLQITKPSRYALMAPVLTAVMATVNILEKRILDRIFQQENQSRRPLKGIQPPSCPSSVGHRTAPRQWRPHNHHYNRHRSHSFQICQRTRHLCSFELSQYCIQCNRLKNIYLSKLKHFWNGIDVRKILPLPP